MVTFNSQFSILLVFLHLDGQVYLTFGVRFGVDLADAALEEVRPAHVEEDGELLIVVAGDVADEYRFVRLFVVIYHSHSIGVVPIVGFAYET